MYDTSSCVVAQLASINDQQQRPAGWLWREQTVKYQQVPSKNSKLQVKVSSIGNIAVVDIVDTVPINSSPRSYRPLPVKICFHQKSRDLSVSYCLINSRRRYGM